MSSEPVLNAKEQTASVIFPKVFSTFVQQQPAEDLPEILFITSYPPRECGIATYSQDLLKALNNKFSDSFLLRVCALESENTNHIYPAEVENILHTNQASAYTELARTINDNKRISLVLMQHEFGFFQQTDEKNLLEFLYQTIKPIIIVFHTVLPNPDELLRKKVNNIITACHSIVVMTRSAAQVLITDYGVPAEKIEVIAHGTHLVPHLSKEVLKEKYGLSGRKILSTFGLLSAGKGIETTLNSLPAIIQLNPDALFLIIGKTHPGVIATEGEKYRDMLEAKVEELSLQQHVLFINRYLPLQDLLEYLQLTDIYLFTSRDPNQAVSGTFSYAMSCGCPIISTPIPHAQEVLREDTGIIIEFQNSKQLADAVNLLMSNETLRKEFSSSTLQRIVPTSWENSAIAYAFLFQKAANSTLPAASLESQAPCPVEKIPLQYRLPSISLDHLKKMTTDIGIIQFSKINQPDISSGYTLDDNARALIALCMHYELTGDQEDLKYIAIYLEFITYCLQPDGNFLNYVDSEKRFTGQNDATNLADANGRAIWALGYLISKKAILPPALNAKAERNMKLALLRVERIRSTRAMAFAIKGLYYFNLTKKSRLNSTLIKTLADRLVQMYRHESEQNWQWYESYLTYANSILPEAMLCAWLDVRDPQYKEIALSTLSFLLSLTFTENGIKVISNKSWLYKGHEVADHGEQPIDVAYTIFALSKFYDAFQDRDHLLKMKTAFNWFLGNNHLQQIIYNPCTGGCYDGLEENHVNLNQGAESTVSYLMARLAIEQYKNE